MCCRPLMEKGANDSRDSGHHRRHLGDCDSALHHRGSVLLPAPGTRGRGGAVGSGAQSGALQRAGPPQGQASKKVQGSQPCPASTCEGSVVASQTPCEAKLQRFGQGEGLSRHHTAARRGTVVSPRAAPPCRAHPQQLCWALCLHERRSHVRRASRVCSPAPLGYTGASSATGRLPEPRPPGPQHPHLQMGLGPCPCPVVAVGQNE